jgi:hypothetical protein
MADLYMTAGDTFARQVTLEDETGAKVNDPAAVYRLTAKRRRSDAVVVIEATANQYAPGVAIVSVDGSATAGITAVTELIYDIDVREGDGRETTVESGRLTISPPVHSLTEAPT